MKCNFAIVSGDSQLTTQKYGNETIYSVDQLSEIPKHITRLVSIGDCSNEVLKYCEGLNIEQLILIYPTPLVYSQELNRNIKISIINGKRNKNYLPVLNSVYVFSNRVDIYRESDYSIEFSPLDILKEFLNTHTIKDYTFIEEVNSKIEIVKNNIELEKQVKLQQEALTNYELLCKDNRVVEFTV